jgi:hypothetical protein
MEEERAFLLESRSVGELQQLLDQLREIRQRKQLLWEQLEARQEETQELFEEVVLSFNTWKASVSSSDSEASQPSDDERDDTQLLLPPPPAFADPDPAVPCMREELPYRPALSLRRPPACFPRPVFRQSLGMGGTARDSPWERYYKPALPLLPDKVGSDGTGKPSGPGDCQPMVESPTLIKPLSLLWSGAWGNWPVWERGDEPADRRGQPRNGAVEARGGTSRPNNHPPGVSLAVWQQTQTGSRPWGGKPPDGRVELPDKGRTDHRRALGVGRDRTALG